MDCHAARDLIQDLLDGELHADDAAAVEGHLAECRTCRQTFGELSSLDGYLRNAMNPLRAPERLAYKVSVSVQYAGPAAAGPHRRLAWRPIAAVAACLLLAVGLWITVRETGGPARVRRAANATVTAPAAEPFPATAEPSDGSLFAIGPAFVIARDGLKPYDGNTRISVHSVRHDRPTLLVEAFPDR